ncbi:MAG: RNA polymerase sigma factor [Alphaproteobacteria bacterium]|nr:RNA polymerase sigma factor [Alphaproteobacteria bacterium]
MVYYAIVFRFIPAFIIFDTHWNKPSFVSYSRRGDKGEHVTSFQNQLLELIPRLRRFAVALTGNLADGDDLLQAAVERALRRRETFDRSLRMDSWIFKIAQNIWIDQKRSEKRRGQSVDIDDQTDLAGDDGRVHLEQRQMTRKVLEAIAALPEQQRLVVGHVLVDGKSYSEAADCLGVPIGTVMSRLSRARKTLEAEVLGTEAIQ